MSEAALVDSLHGEYKVPGGKLVVVDLEIADDRIARFRLAGDFFLESLSAYEMVQRGFSEARESASLERRHIEMSRRLSTFLADASLALDASNSLEEMLQLVAEQARELVGADCCVATVALHGQPRAAAGQVEAPPVARGLRQD